MYEIEYSESFQKSLEETISYWQLKLKLPDDKISEFVSSMYKSTKALKQYPYLAEDVAARYGFNQPTYRVRIGKSYAFFYRINQNKIEIDSLYDAKQMKVSF